MPEQRDEAYELVVAQQQSEIESLRAQLAAANAEVQEQTKAAADVLAERKRQKDVEGWTPEHDDEHAAEELATAAGCYAIFGGAYPKAGEPPHYWPWMDSRWKPADSRRNLVKAGALILAEIERLDRAATVCRHPNMFPKAIGPTLDEYVCPDCGKSGVEGD